MVLPARNDAVDTARLQAALAGPIRRPIALNVERLLPAGRAITRAAPPISGSAQICPARGARLGSNFSDCSIDVTLRDCLVSAESSDSGSTDYARYGGARPPSTAPRSWCGLKRGPCGLKYLEAEDGKATRWKRKSAQIDMPAVGGELAIEFSFRELVGQWCANTLLARASPNRAHQNYMVSI
jgi:hypothetical protein